MQTEIMKDLVQRQLIAYNNRNLEDFCQCFHPKVKVTKLVSGEVLCVGKEKFRELYKNLFDSSPNLHCELKSRIVLETTVIDEEFVTGAAKYPQGVHAVAIYGFHDQLISQIWFPK
ncbi:MAG TPA: nuclear transport factor 2 family protein [Pseudobdellovibrionaceae bacterium]|nr:nuclear transport factor 2 family protein [Pseudobdellovibrionaceae bacterium]